MPQNRSAPAFRQEPVAVTIALTLLTLGLYVPWWLYRQTRVIHAHAGTALLPMWLVHAGMVSGIVSFGIGVTVLLGAGGSGGPPGPDPLLQTVNLVANVVVITWVFLVRHGINGLARAKPGDADWVNLGFTILLSLIYVQYKINRILEARRGAPPGG
jgi:hypothetical protein